MKLFDFVGAVKVRFGTASVAFIRPSMLQGLRFDV